MTKNTHLQTILIVEDHMDDYEFTKKSFKEAGLANPLQLCRTGEEALDFLYQQGSFVGNSEVPGLVLLDLNLPKKSGLEVLKEMNCDSDLKLLPVVVLTSSDDEQDIRVAYSEGAKGYIKKPVTLDELVKALKLLNEYFFGLVILPKLTRDGTGGKLK